MRTGGSGSGAVLLLGLFFTACAATGAGVVVDRGSSVPGTTVKRLGKEVKLTGTPIAVGRRLPATTLTDAATMGTVDLSAQRGKVLLLSLVVSVDTGV